MLSRLRPRPAPPPDADDDRSLLARFARTGDEAAFARLVARHGPLVLGVCRRVLRDPHAADDAFQATFLVLARKADRVRPASLASWLFGVARRVSLAARRRELRLRNAEQGARDQSSTPRSEPCAPHSADWSDLLRVLDAELDRLPDHLRAPVLECFFRERTQDEAAKALGWSLSTVRRRLDRAKGLLRARLTARGVGLPAALLAGALAGAASAAVPPALANAAVGVGLAAKAGKPVAAGVASLAATGGAKLAAVSAVALGVAVVGLGLGLGRSEPVPPAVPPVPAVAEPVPEVIAPPRPGPAPIVPPAPSVPAAAPHPAPPVVPPKPPAPPPSPDAEPARWVTIRGRVKLSNPPAPKRVEVKDDKAFCEKDGPVVSEELVVNPKNGGVRSVVVWLRPDSPDRKAPFPRDAIHPDLLDAKPVNRVVEYPCCQFVPRVVAARAGDTLEFKNSSKVNHSINYTSDIESLGPNIPPGRSHKLVVPLAAQASPIPFKCDVHPWMAGRLRVFEHPYFAVTDANGDFVIPDAPAGRWRLVVWHELGFHKGRAGVLGAPLELAGPAVEVPDVELELPK